MGRAIERHPSSVPLGAMNDGEQRYVEFFPASAIVRKVGAEILSAHAPLLGAAVALRIPFACYERRMHPVQ